MLPSIKRGILLLHLSAWERTSSDNGTTVRTASRSTRQQLHLSQQRLSLPSPPLLSRRRPLKQTRDCWAAKCCRQWQDTWHGEGMNPWTSSINLKRKVSRVHNTAFTCSKILIFSQQTNCIIVINPRKFSSGDMNTEHFYNMTSLVWHTYRYVASRSEGRPWLEAVTEHGNGQVFRT
jgi:hypothetical protein